MGVEFKPQNQIKEKQQGVVPDCNSVTSQIETNKFWNFRPDNVVYMTISQPLWDTVSEAR